MNCCIMNGTDIGGEKMSEKSGFCLISFHRVAFDGEITERLIRSLRFGERETDRLLKIKNSRGFLLAAVKSFHI